MWIKQEAILKLLGVYILSNPTNGYKQIDSLAKQEGVCTHQ